MTEDINKAYVQKYLDKALITDNQELKKDYLYRIGTHIEVIPCNGNSDLTPRQQNRIFYEATKLLQDNNKPPSQGHSAA